MTDQTRNLLISLASHMAYMQGQLEALHELDDPEDFYWYRESVALRQKVTDALADEPASVVEEPSDEEIMELMPRQMHEDLSAAVRAMAEQEGIDSTRAKGVMRIMLNRHVVDLARAVLARYGHQPAPPADGEVAELVAWLRNMAEAGLGGLDELNAGRTAALLEQRHPAPVPVIIPKPQFPSPRIIQEDFLL